MRKVNDQKIYKNKYYPWYYKESLKVNLVPISYYTREEALFTLEKQFGNKGMLELKVIKGSFAIKEGLELGKNSFRLDGKSHQVKKYYVPPEYQFNRSRRRTYFKLLKRRNKDNQPSGVVRLHKTYKLKTYGTR